MRYIQSNDIHPELRFMGKVFSTMFSSFDEKAFQWANRFMDIFMKGKWLGRYSDMKEVDIPRSDGSFLRLCICCPKGDQSENATGVLWIHGGGYAIGLPEQDFQFADLFMEVGNCVVVMPDYRRATEAPYPAALEDCYLSLKWMKENAEQLGINPNQLFVGGDSAGGGLTAALCLYARDKEEVKVAFQMPLYPMLDYRMETPSSQNNDAPVWNTCSNKNAWDLYLRGLNEVPIYASPALAEDHSDLPPTFTYVGTIEPFYDETKEYVSRLRDAGVKVWFKEYRGCYHGFDIVCGKSRPAKHARAFLKHAFKYAQNHFYREQNINEAKEDLK